LCVPKEPEFFLKKREKKGNTLSSNFHSILKISGGFVCPVKVPRTILRKGNLKPSPHPNTLQVNNIT
jgi:hypothetical protein